MQTRVTLEELLYERLRDGRIDRELFELLWELAERNGRVATLRVKRGSCIRVGDVEVCVERDGGLAIRG